MTSILVSLLSSLLAGTASTYIIVKYFDVPFFVFLFVYATLILTNAMFIKQTMIKLFCIYLASTLAGVGLAELYVWNAACKIRKEIIVQNKDFYASSPTLGYKLNPGASMLVRGWIEDNKIYEATYSVNEDGFRAIPQPQHADHAQKCVLLFGGSYTFGEGLNDDQTLAYYISSRASETVQVYNFGVSGYGPHHMLSSLQKGIIDRATKDCQGEIIAIYQAIRHHVKRAVGRAPWDRHGPKYELRDDGTVQLVGRFFDNKRSFLEKVLTRASDELHKSVLYERLIDPQGIRRPVNRLSIRENYWDKYEIMLFGGIVQQTRDIIEAMDGEFHVILWEIGDGKLSLSAELKGRKIRVHDISTILPGYERRPEHFTLHRCDSHPKASTNRIIADFILREILRPS